MWRRFGLLALVVSAVSVTDIATAAPIAYTETSGGDLAGDGSVGQVLTSFTLDAGTNTVSGDSSSSDTDSFAFVVPVGLQVNSLTLMITGPISGQAGWTLRSGSALAYTGTVLDAIEATILFGTSANDAIDPARLPLGPQTYNLSWSIISRDPIAYTMSFGVAAVPQTAVPEPASLSLLGFGLIGLGARRWRQRRQS